MERCYAGCMTATMFYHPADSKDALRAAAHELDPELQDMRPAAVANERMPRGRIFVLLEGGLSADAD